MNVISRKVRVLVLLLIYFGMRAAAIGDYVPEICSYSNNQVTAIRSSTCKVWIGGYEACVYCKSASYPLGSSTIETTDDDVDFQVYAAGQCSHGCTYTTGTLDASYSPDENVQLISQGTEKWSYCNPTY